MAFGLIKAMRKFFQTKKHLFVCPRCLDLFETEGPILGYPMCTGSEIRPLGPMSKHWPQIMHPVVVDRIDWRRWRNGNYENRNS